jgi:hypothetical protein
MSRSRKVPAQHPRSLEATTPLQATPERVLLIHTPVYDTRLNWGEWQQPTTLLRLATYWGSKNAQVHLIDGLYQGSSRFRRESAGKVEIDGREVSRWRFGASAVSIRQSLEAYVTEGWIPDQVYIECGATFWWQGTQEVADLVRQAFPTAVLIVTGPYASVAPEHVQTHISALLLSQTDRKHLFDLPATLNIYEHKLPILHVSFGNGSRSAEEIVQEIANAKTRARAFSFVDDWVVSQHSELFREVLEKILEKNLKVKLYAIGNVAFHDLNNLELVTLMWKAGYRQINFADDRHLPRDETYPEFFLNDARDVVEHCRKAGFKPRTDALNAGLCVGKIGEDLAERTRVATLLAHHVGSVIVWPHQPEPELHPEFSLEALNGKHFPLRAHNGYRYDDYLEFLGLAAILNAKYRGETFDFLGEGFMSRLFRDSVARQGWNPDPAVKGNVNPLSRRTT